MNLSFDCPCGATIQERGEWDEKETDLSVHCTDCDTRYVITVTGMKSLKEAGIGASD